MKKPNPNEFREDARVEAAEKSLLYAAARLPRQVSSKLGHERDRSAIYLSGLSAVDNVLRNDISGLPSGQAFSNLSWSLTQLAGAANNGTGDASFGVSADVVGQVMQAKGEYETAVEADIANPDVIEVPDDTPPTPSLGHRKNKDFGLN